MPFCVTGSYGVPMPDSSIRWTLLIAYAQSATIAAGCSYSWPVETSVYDTPTAFFLEESSITFVTHECVRSSKLGCAIAFGITVMCGLPFALASQPKRSQCPQYTHAPRRDPSGFVYARDAFAHGRGNG